MTQVRLQKQANFFQSTSQIGVLDAEVEKAAAAVATKTVENTVAGNPISTAYNVAAKKLQRARAFCTSSYAISYIDASNPRINLGGQVYSVNLGGHNDHLVDNVPLLLKEYCDTPSHTFDSSVLKPSILSKETKAKGFNAANSWLDSDFNRDFHRELVKNPFSKYTPCGKSIPYAFPKATGSSLQIKKTLKNKNRKAFEGGKTLVFEKCAQKSLLEKDFRTFFCLRGGHNMESLFQTRTPLERVLVGLRLWLLGVFVWGVLAVLVLSQARALAKSRYEQEFYLPPKNGENPSPYAIEVRKRLRREQYNKGYTRMYINVMLLVFFLSLCHLLFICRQPLYTLLRNYITSFTQKKTTPASKVIITFK